MSHGNEPKPHIHESLEYRLEHWLHQFGAIWLPLLVAVFSFIALIWWPSQQPVTDIRPLAFRAVLHVDDKPWNPEQAKKVLAGTSPVERFSTQLSEAPVWSLIDLPVSRDRSTRVLEFPSRHGTALRCWDGTTLSLLGQADRSGNQGGIDASRAGFALNLSDETAQVICEALFVGPAHMSTQLLDLEALTNRDREFQRNSGLLDGGMLVLAAFILIAGFVNRDTQYLLFASWLVINLRMAALSSGWDYQWLGHHVPLTWLRHLRPLTLALYYVVTFALFTSLFREELRAVGHRWIIKLALWTCLPLVLLSQLLPYAMFLPLIWGTTGLGIAGLVFMLLRILALQRSRVAIWYAASIGVALFASLYEVVAAALGLTGLLGTINSTTAALSSSLLASLAIGEQIRLEHQQKLEAEEELRHTYEVIPIGLFTLDRQGQILSANPALVEMLGSAESHKPGKSWSQLFAEQIWPVMAQQALAGQSVEMEVSLQRPGLESSRLWVKAAPANERIEGTLQDISEKAKATEHLQYLANHDPLTRTLNRRGIESTLEDARRALASGKPLAVAYLDLDRFKLINDLYGHPAGDEVLQQVCSRVQTHLTDGMRLGRMGGDEFLIVLPDTPLSQASLVCREIVQGLIDKPFLVGDRAFHVRGSIGLIQVRQGSTAKDIVSTADRACQDAKQNSTEGMVVFEENSRVLNEHEAQLVLIEKLSTQEAVEGLFLEMQPIMSLRTPFQSLNFEVLLRMKDEHGDRVPTDRLIHAGERAGRMGVIDRWVLTQTLHWLEQHAATMAHNQFVCLNLSGASLNDERFLDDAFLMLESHRSVATRLCLEVTESVALSDMGNTRRFIDRIRAFGAKVALDDFGAGYTSFSYLKDLPADLLKIDGSFIVNMNRHPANIAIVEAIVSLAQNLGMKTIAEWAEDFETVETLAEIGVDYVQGFVVARPQDPERLRLAASGAAFIQDAQLQHYLQQLAPEDEFSHVDLVLGQTSGPAPQGH